MLIYLRYGVNHSRARRTPQDFDDQPAEGESDEQLSPPPTSAVNIFNQGGTNVFNINGGEVNIQYVAEV